MIVEIPDELIIKWANCHPDTSVEEVIEIIHRSLSKHTESFYKYIGEYVIRNVKFK